MCQVFTQQVTCREKGYVSSGSHPHNVSRLLHTFCTVTNMAWNLAWNWLYACIHVHVAYFLGLGFGYRQSGLGWSHLQDNHGGTYAHSQMLAGMYLCSER